MGPGPTLGDSRVREAEGRNRKPPRRGGDGGKWQPRDRCGVVDHLSAHVQGLV